MGLTASADVATAIEELNRRLGLPENLREMGVPDEVLPRMIDGAVADHSTVASGRFLQAGLP